MELKGTKNIIDLCIKYNVPNLIYTSSALVTLVPYLGKGTFSIIVNQTEVKAKTPSTDSQFLIPGFPASKLRAEKMVLSAYGLKLSNGKGHLNTVALRPTLMYGECDERFFPTIMRLADRFNGKIPRIAEGGKKQLSYVGNVAWAHLCTKNKLMTDPKKISGLPIFVTDDTPVIDTVRLSQRINLDMEVFKIKPTSWSIPFLLCYMIAMLLEFVLKIVNIFTKMSIEYCPRGLMSFGSSLVLYDRLRASIACEYEPIYTASEGFSRSGKWYDSWYQNFKNQQTSLRTKST